MSDSNGEKIPDALAPSANPIPTEVQNASESKGLLAGLDMMGGAGLAVGAGAVGMFGQDGTLI